MSFSPKEIFHEIKTHYSEFTISYKTDYRQKIADSWPQSINDNSAKSDWSWNPIYPLKNMVEDMILATAYHV